MLKTKYFCLWKTENKIVVKNLKNVRVGAEQKVVNEHLTELWFWYCENKWPVGMEILMMEIRNDGIWILMMKMMEFW